MMPLSKARNRERMRALRAQPGGIESYDDNKKSVRLGCTTFSVQPIEAVPELDADGNPIPDYE